MESINFIIYDKKHEEKNGDYWKFLDATKEELENDKIHIPVVTNTIKKISNQELKDKMKEKILKLIKENGIFNVFGEDCLKIFNEQQIKDILEHDIFNNDLKKYSLDDLESNIYNVNTFLRLLTLVNDYNWQYQKAKEVLDIIKKFNNKIILATIIENQNYNETLYNALIKDYYEYLPLEYQAYLKLSKDRNYISNKKSKFMNIDIGIDPRISIGAEIEANKKLPIKFHVSDQYGYEEYMVKNEATVPNGDEIVSHKPFHNTKDEVASFCALCDTMSEIGYYYDEINPNAAGQINLGLDYLDSAQAILNFYEIFGNCEKLLYYISNEEGQLFRQNIYTNSRIKAISKIIGKRIVDEDIKREEVINLFNIQKYGNNENIIDGLQYKKNSVCLRGESKETLRFEIRIPNGGCNYQTWIDNIRLYGKIMEISKKLADLMKKDYLTKEENNLLNNKIELQNDNLSLEEKLVLLMNLLFEDKNIRNIYYSRYKSTIKKIIETDSQAYEREFITTENDFDEVEFEGQYKSKLDHFYSGKGILSYDPDTGEYIINGRKKHI